MRHPARLSVLMTVFWITATYLLVSVYLETNLTFAIPIFLLTVAIIAVRVLIEVLWLREQHRNK